MHQNFGPQLRKLQSQEIQFLGLCLLQSLVAMMFQGKLSLPSNACFPLLSLPSTPSDQNLRSENLILM